jgi:hypothetical protein
MSQRGDALADRLEQGARALGRFANALSDTEWRSRVPKDGRNVGVVHHVATMYPLEIQLAQKLAGGQPVAPPRRQGLGEALLDEFLAAQVRVA